MIIKPFLGSYLLCHPPCPGKRVSFWKITYLLPPGLPNVTAQSYGKGMKEEERILRSNGFSNKT